MGMDDFMGGGLAIGSKKSKLDPKEDQIENKITEEELQQKKSLEE